MQSQNDGAIAQLVEQRTENPCVPGSIPGGTTQKPCRNAGLFWFVALPPAPGPFRPQKGYLLWRSCSCWPLLSTERVSFVEELFSLAPSVHKKGVFCGGVGFSCTLCPRQRYPVWRECIPKCFIPIGFVTQGMVRLTISASADVR